MHLVYAFAAWSVFVWGTRISNILGDEVASTADKALDLTVAGGLTALALAAALAAWRGRPAWALPALVVATVAVWAVRTPLILLDGGHGVAFKVVHAALAAVSVTLALAAWRQARSRPPKGSGSGSVAAKGAARVN